MTDQQDLRVDWKNLSGDAGRRMGFGARLWLFGVGVLALFAPGTCLVVLMRIVAKMIIQETDNSEQIVLFVKTLGAK